MTLGPIRCSAATAHFLRSTILQPVRFSHHKKHTGKPLMSYMHGASSVPLLNDTIGQRLRMAADNVPDKEVFVFRQTGIRKTFSEFLTDCEKLATGLISLGLEKGDRVGMWGPNTYEWVVCQFATALAGFVMVNINPAYQSAELKYALHKVGVKALISPPSFKKSNYYQSLISVIPEIANGSENCGAVRSHELPEFKHLIMSGGEAHRGAWKYDDIINAGGSDARATLNVRETDSQPDDAVNVQFTSGTTGQPKGAVLTHHNIVNNAYFVGRRSNLHLGKDILCVPNPLYHCMGCVTGSLSVVIHQNTCVFPAPSFESLAALKAVHDEKCTVLFGTPTMFIDMLNQPEFSQFDYSSLRAGFMAGAPCPIELCRQLVKDMNMRDIQIGYGTTETSPVSFMSILDDPPEKRVRSVGHIMDHVEAVIVDGQGRALPRGQRGELLVRGYLVMPEYWEDQQKTNAAITPDRWYHSGDVALMNDDGSVQIVGRTKDMIVRGGENIYPTEIEQFLFQHPLIEDVHVVGVPDERFGEEVCAWIRLHENAKPSEVTAETVKEFCKGKIAHYKVPRYILFKKEHDFPLTVTGKVQKYKLRELSKVELGLEQVKSHFNE